MGTRWALFRGRTRPPRFLSRDILWLLDQQIAEGVVSVAPSGLEPLQVAEALKTHMPELDLRALRPRRGFPRGHNLAWGDGEERVSVLARIDGEGPSRRLQMLIYLHHGSGMDVVHQEIMLVGGQRPGDRFMRCPVTGRRILKAYFREGRFASAQAQILH